MTDATAEIIIPLVAGYILNILCLGCGYDMIFQSPILGKRSSFWLKVKKWTVLFLFLIPFGLPFAAGIIAIGFVIYVFFFLIGLGITSFWELITNGFDQYENDCDPDEANS